MKKNVIHRLKINEEIVEGKDKLQDKIREYFLEHFKQEENPRITLLMGSFKMLDPAILETLEACPTFDEIWSAIRSFDLGKSPGYAGFNMRFVMEFWGVIGDDVMTFVMKFFQSVGFPASINTTWITLISKYDSATSTDDFRLVSMVGFLYKIISKIIVRRLSSVMGALISESQSGFMKDRNITDGIITANEALSWLKEKKKET